jgi:hypothetical protein
VTFFDKEGKNFWNMTQMIYEDIEHEKHHVELNILNSVLEHYKEIDTIFLFVTNQSHHQDTYYAGKIIEHVLQHKYTVRLIEKTDDPRIREKAFQFFECFYKEEKILYNHQVIICGSGGIPAMKEGLIFYGSFLPDSVICDVDEHTHQVFESKVAQEYLKNMKKNTLKEMIRKYEFSGANHFIQNFKGKKKTEIEKYLSYLNYRYNFDFEEANKLIEDCKSKYVREIDINDSKMLLEELVSNIDISYQKGEYLSCLGKIFALTELLIKQLFQERYALNPEKDFEAIQKLPGIDGKDIQ